jgi:hypothetical protein
LSEHAGVAAGANVGCRDGLRYSNNEMTGLEPNQLVACSIGGYTRSCETWSEHAI